MKKALIICNHKATKAHPNGIRLIHFGHMLQNLGYAVEIYGIGDDGSNIDIQGICCTEWKQLKGHGFKLHFQRKKDYINNIKSVLTDDVEVVISAISTIEVRARKFLRNYCRKNNIVFASSIVEWFNINNFGYKYLYRLFLNEYAMIFDNRKDKNIIGISTYLTNYYRKQKCNSIYVPTIIDSEEYSDCIYKPNDRITVMYAGSPGKKDSILNAVYALGLLNEEELKRIRFVIFGVDEKKLKKLGLTDEFMSKIGDSLQINGRIPQEEVKKNIASADYTVLLRRITRNAKAGFSTKVGESMACGTPVIANYTGDLEKYVIDGKTGIVCDDETPESCAKAYRKALAISEDNYSSMRDFTRKMAFDEFDYKNYVSIIKKFIEEAKV